MYRAILLSFLLFVGCNQEKKKYFDYTIMAQNHTTSNSSTDAFAQLIDINNSQKSEEFLQGRLFFKTLWVASPASTKARDGLGPLYSAPSCISCHPNNAQGNLLDAQNHLDKSLIIKVANPEAQEYYSEQISSFANSNLQSEATVQVDFTYSPFTYPDGSRIQLKKPTFTLSNLLYGDVAIKSSARIALALVGLGEIEKIPENAILAHQDVNDSNSDGISGRANYVYDIETNSTKLGRFTWKSAQPSILQQSATAFHHDMGITSPLYPNENCAKKELECKKQQSKEVDINLQRLKNVALYLSLLKVPAQRDAKKVQKGATLFHTIGCVKCHIDTFKTTQGDIIHPFSDFLLHDMGSELDGGMGEALATSREWRSAPLWGIGLSKKANPLASYLHDGRASSLEEAILWHGGEAEESRFNFTHLNKSERESLLDFLHSL